MADFDYLTDLPGEDRERRWIQERLETLSVRESIALAAAAQCTLPVDMAQAINCLQSLDGYEIRLDAGSYEALGLSYLRDNTTMPENALPYIDLTAVGQQYEDKHPGLFIGNCYVEYPKKDPTPAYCQGGPLPEDNSWSVKLKLASPAVPGGVWLRLPGQEFCADESSTEETLALRELRVACWNECSLLDAQCTLPQAGNLLEQYDSVAELIYDGINLDCILDELGQGCVGFVDRYAAALELEGCHDLRLALDISQNLDCYEWVSCDDLEASAAGLLLDAKVSEDLIYSGSIDLKGYKAHLLEEEGYTPTADGCGYIRRNEKEFCYQLSTPAPEEPGITMQ